MWSFIVVYQFINKPPTNRAPLCCSLIDIVYVKQDKKEWNYRLRKP